MCSIGENRNEHDRLFVLLTESILQSNLLEKLLKVYSVNIYLNSQNMQIIIMKKKIELKTQKQEAKNKKRKYMNFKRQTKLSLP